MRESTTAGAGEVEACTSRRGGGAAGLDNTWAPSSDVVAGRIGAARLPR
jgi:hypothetical protein